MIEIGTGMFFTLIATSILITFSLLYLLSRKQKNQLTTLFTSLFVLLLIWIIGLVLQVTFSNKYNINPIYFDYFVYIGICFLPVIFLLLSTSFANSKFNFNKKYKLLFIIPTISLILLWSNNYHHLFYKTYSINQNEAIFGIYFSVHSIYTYLLYIIGFFNLIKYSIKNSGFFSKQAILVFLGCLIPFIINLLGSIGLIPISIYTTPITFALAILFVALAIFKFDFLKVAPIALQRIVDRMSDAYIVLNEDNQITDYNKTFTEVFSIGNRKIRNLNLLDSIASNSNIDINIEELLNAIEASKKSNDTITIQKHFSNLNKYFNVEINSITNKGSFLGTLILLKDVTQHNIDMQTIKDNQDMLVEKERLASLGQMIGGIAHNLKTPIMSIGGAAEGLSDLIKEYDNSIEDPNVNFKDHHDIASDMNEWIAKIRTHLSYMSDVITAVKGQAVAFADNTSKEFTVDELVKYVDILMKHELKNALINLNTSVSIDVNTNIKGNINSLVQVVNNIISNAIQAYNGKENKDIDFSLYQENNRLIIKVQDYAGGLPDNVKNKLFKEMITTKGKNGTGLGLFMSYSNIRAHFNGGLRFETAKGKGTSFFIEIPL